MAKHQSRLGLCAAQIEFWQLLKCTARIRASAENDIAVREEWRRHRKSCTRAATSARPRRKSSEIQNTPRKTASAGAKRTVPHRPTDRVYIIWSCATIKSDLELTLCYIRHLRVSYKRERRRRGQPREKEKRETSTAAMCLFELYILCAAGERERGRERQVYCLLQPRSFKRVI